MTTAIKSDFAEDFADAWIAAWNSHDLERVLSHYDRDFEMSSPRIVEIAGEPSGVLKGEAVGAYWKKALELIPNLRFEKLGVFIGIKTIGIHYRNHAGKLAFEVLEIGDSGKVARASALYET